MFMTAIKPFFKLITFAFALLLAVGIAIHFPPEAARSQQPSSSQTLSNGWPAYEPDPRIGKPDRREGGGTRGPTITALVPATVNKQVNFGTTVSGYPSFVFYVTETKEVDNASLEFTLENSAGEIIYKSAFTHSGPARPIAISLPEYRNLPPLEENKPYYWACTLVLDLDPENDEPTKKIAGGWIKRIKLSPSLENQLKQVASPREKADIYKKNLIWYDALNTLVEARRAKPNDPALSADWKGLLESVGLDKVLPETILQGSGAGM